MYSRAVSHFERNTVILIAFHNSPRRLELIGHAETDAKDRLQLLARIGFKDMALGIPSLGLLAVRF
ncbi:MAG TPA: hypothetical protein VGM50_02180 [Gemmatimonadaceae bacterium]